MCIIPCDPLLDDRNCKVSAITNTLQLQAGYQMYIAGIQCLRAGGSCHRVLQSGWLINNRNVDHTLRDAGTPNIRLEFGDKLGISHACTLSP